MKLTNAFCFIATTLATTAMSSAAIYSVDGLNPRTVGPITTDASLTAGGTIGDNHGGVPLTLNFTVSNQDLDGDGNLDDSFTFDLIASTTNANANGVSTWGQGLSNSNAAGTGNAFSSLNGVSITVGNIVGATSNGDSVVFDGFSAATIASGSGGVVDRSIDAGGLSYVLSSPSTGAFQFVQNNQSFASPQPTLTFSNQGGTTGSLVVRSLDLQFSTVPIPEPSSAVLGSLALLGFMARRRR